MVIQAATMARGGEIFVLDMGEPVKIIDLARDLILLSGFKPEVDIGIEFIGLRPGEKLYEELHLSDEDVDKTSHDKIFVLKNGGNEDIDCYRGEVDKLRAMLLQFTDSEAVGALRRVVPNFRPPDPDNSSVS